MTSYALALSDEEVARYRMMAETARDRELELWSRAGVVEGAAVADVGCGPAMTTLVLAEVVGPSGRVVGIDAAEDTVAAARALCEQAGAGNVVVAHGRADATGLEPSSFDVAMMRHVLAHNADAEQQIVDHLASLVRPGGSVYLVDNDGTAVRSWPIDPDLEDLTERYRRWHQAQGNDLMVGLRLGDLLEAAGLELVEHTGRWDVIPVRPGFRSPAWAGREALLAAGLAEEDDVARWDAAFERVGAAERAHKVFVPQFCAFGRRPR